MDAVLRQSKAVCPFLKRASPDTLRALSTATRPRASPCGGTMSKLQLLARRCPVMGKALAVQSARAGTAGLASLAGRGKAGSASLHTSRPREARAVEGHLFEAREKREFRPAPPPLLPSLGDRSRR